MDSDLSKYTSSQFARFQEQICAELGATDTKRLRAFLELIESDTRKANLGTIYSKLYPEHTEPKAGTAFRKFQLNFNNASKEAGLTVRLIADTKKQSPANQRTCWIEGPDTVLLELEAFSSSDAQNLHEHEPIPARLKPQDLRTPVLFFLSYAHENAIEAEKLKTALLTQLKPSRKFRFSIWTDEDLIVGRKWHSAILKALHKSHLGLLLVSPEFLVRDYIKEHELPPFLTGDKPCIPVELKKIDFKNHNTLGLEERQIFRHTNGKNTKAFAELTTTQQRDKFAEQLAQAIHRHLDDSPPPPPTFDQPSTPSPNPSSALEHPQFEKMANQAAFDPDCKSFVPTRARPWAIDQQEKPQDDNQSEPALEFLTQWATEKGQPPLFALLGEYGMGKTTTLKRFTTQLLTDRKNNPKLPLPIYIDLRHKITTANGVPTLDEILTGALHRNWKGSDKLSITSRDLIKLVREGRALVIFDGLDEQIVHFNEAGAQAFIRELWSLTPPNLLRTKGSPETRVLISCRSHYFRDLRQQDNILTGEQREGFRSSDYKVAFVLPFEEDQIRSYLTQELGENDGSKAVTLLTEIHNLRNLAERPYLLSLISQHIEKLEMLKASGRTVRPVTLYGIMARKWLDRDDGKHHFDPDHKLLLMGALAADLFRSGKREWPWERLATWLDQYLLDHPLIASRYQNKERSLLGEDLRTATFILRPDSEEKNFRFAHSSIQEFFLANHLFRSLIENDFEGWNLPTLPREALSFFGQLLETEEKDPEALLNLAKLLEAGTPQQGAINAFQYLLQASYLDLPLPCAQSIQLAGADLNEWNISTSKDKPPLNLANADFSGANLRRTKWSNLNLSGASFNKAELHQSDFSNCLLEGSSWNDTALIAGNLTDCSVKNIQSEKINIRDTYTHRCNFLPQLPTQQGSIKNATLELISGQTIFTSASYSPDGSKIISVSENSLKLWDAHSAKLLLSFEGHSNTVNSAAFSPDGSRIVSASDDKSLKIWDALSATQLHSLDAHSAAINSAKYSSDGTKIISASSDLSLKLWDANSGALLRAFKGHNKLITSAAFSPDGSKIVSTSWDRTLKLWDTHTAKLLFSFEGHHKAVSSAEFSPDGSKIISSSWDRSLKLWDTHTAKLLLSFNGHSSRVTTAEFSPDGSKVISASYDGTVKLWDARSAKLLASFEGHSSRLSSAAFSPDGSKVISASWDHSLKLWDTQLGILLLTIEGHSDAITSVAFSPDGSKIISVHRDDCFKLWTTKTSRLLKNFGGKYSGFSCASFSPDGSKIISATKDNFLKIWDTQTAEVLLSFEGHSDEIASAYFSPDGSKIISISYDGLVKLWDAQTSESLICHKGDFIEITSARFSPDGSKIIFGAVDGVLCLYDIQSASLLFSLVAHNDVITSVDFSPDGTKIISGSWDHSLKIWESQSSKILLSLEGHSSGVTTVSFSPDGSKILSGSWDHTLKLWDAHSGNLLQSFEGHSSGVSSAAFSPDGSKIVSASHDNTLKLWDAKTGLEIRTTTGHQKNENACIIAREDKIVWAEKNAWRHLQLVLPPTESNPYPKRVPADYFESFPIEETEEK